MILGLSKGYTKKLKKACFKLKFNKTIKSFGSYKNCRIFVMSIRQKRKNNIMTTLTTITSREQAQDYIIDVMMFTKHYRLNPVTFELKQERMLSIYLNSALEILMRRFYEGGIIDNLETSLDELLTDVRTN